MKRIFKEALARIKIAWTNIDPFETPTGFDRFERRAKKLNNAWLIDRKPDTFSPVTHTFKPHARDDTGSPIVGNQWSHRYQVRTASNGLVLYAGGRKDEAKKFAKQEALKILGAKFNVVDTEQGVTVFDVWYSGERFYSSISSEFDEASKRKFDIDAERKAFATWASGLGYNVVRDDDGSYRLTHVEALWLGWKERAKR